MRNHEQNTSPAPMIVIKGGGKTYNVGLENLTEFLDNCHQKLGLAGATDLDCEMAEIIDDVIEGYDNDRMALGLKRHLLFLREVDLLFKGMLYEVRS